MDPKTLTSPNIVVQEGKYSRALTKSFKFIYDEDTDTLYIRFKSEDNSFGTGDWIEVQ